MYPCPHCRVELLTRREYQEHRKSYHEDCGAPSCGCDGCPKLVGPDSRVVDLHYEHRVSVERDKNIVDVLDKIYTCNVPTCPRVFQLYHFFVKHLEQHINEGVPVQCPFPRCCNVYTAVSSFQHHLRTSHVVPSRPVVAVKRKRSSDKIAAATFSPVEGENCVLALNGRIPVYERCKPTSEPTHAAAERQPAVLRQVSFVRNSSAIRPRRRTSRALPLSPELDHTHRILRYRQHVLLPWNRLPASLLNSCDTKQRASAADLDVMVHAIAYYLCNDLGDTSLGATIALADDVCRHFPLTFSDRVDDGGSNSLAAKIYAAVCNRKLRTTRRDSESRWKRRKTSRGRADSCDSPIDYSVRKAAPNVRGLLRQPKSFLTYASSILGKNVCVTWVQGLVINQRILEFMGELKSEANLNIKKTFETLKLVDCELNENTRAIAIFPLLVHYFEENVDLLYVMKNQSKNPVDSIDTVNPVLVIKGESIYDGSAVCTMVIDGSEYMEDINVLQGFLVVFLAYFVFGIEYPVGLTKTLQVIQRLLMDFNPSDSEISKDEKPQCAHVDSDVQKFMEKIQAFQRVPQISQV